MSDEFQLEPPIPPGEISQRVIEELRQAKRIANDYSKAFGDACKAQAEKHGIAPSALRRFVCALEADTLGDLEKEAADVERLIGAES